MVEPIHQSNYAVSESGVLAYATTRSAQLVWVDREGREQPASDELRNYRTPRIAPDGARIAVQNAGRVGILNERRGTFTEFATDRGVGTWSRDRSRLVLIHGGYQKLTMRGVDQSAPDQSVPTNISWPQYRASVSPDGSELALVVTTERSRDVYILPLDGTGEARPFRHTDDATEGGAQFSPDGRHLSFVSDASGRREVYVAVYPGPGAQWQVSTDGGTQPVWNPRGGELFYREGLRMMGVKVGDSPETTSKPEVVFEGDYSYGGARTLPQLRRCRRRRTISHDQGPVRKSRERSCNDQLDRRTEAARSHPTVKKMLAARWPFLGRRC